MTAPAIHDQPAFSVERMTAVGAVAAGGLFAALLVGLHLAEPEFDPRWRFVSEYALGRFGILMTIAFIALAFSLLATAVAVVRHVRTALGYIGLGIIVLAAAGLLLAAAFPTDPITITPDRYSFSGRMHLFGASLDYSPIGMLLIGWAMTRTGGWGRLRRPAMATAGVAFALMVAFIAVLPRDGQFGPGVYAGLVGRLLLLSYIGWTIVVCREVLLRRKQGSLPTR